MTLRAFAALPHVAIASVSHSLHVGSVDLLSASRKRSSVDPAVLIVDLFSSSSAHPTCRDRSGNSPM